MSKTKVFLDTSVFVYLLQDEQQHLWVLFSDDSLKRFTYIINPVVYQELLLAAERTSESVSFEAIDRHIQLLPLDYLTSSEKLQQQVRELRNRVVHSNDVLILGSVIESECEYFLTYDQALIKASQGLQFDAMTPEDFISAKQVSE